MGGEEQGPSPLQGSTGGGGTNEEHGPSPLQGSTGANSGNLHGLQALTSISQVSSAAPRLLIQPQTECSEKQRHKAWNVN